MMGTALAAADSSGFEQHAPGLEWRALERRAARPTGSTLFESLPPDRTGISTEISIPNLTRYFTELTASGGYYGVCTGDVDNDGWTDFFVTCPTGDNRLYRNQGGFVFEDITLPAGIEEGLVWSSGASFADLNNDGWLDLFVCRYMQSNKLFINQGVGTNGLPRFVESAAEYGLDSVRASMQMAFADYDNDGDLDGYLATTYVNPPPGTRMQVRYEDNVPYVVDELREYWELVTNLPGERATVTDSGQFDHLFRNDGERFTDVTGTAGIDGTGSTLAAVAWDYNSDGWPDFYVANDFHATDKLYLNNRDGTFRDIAGDALPHTPLSSMGCDFGDLDNDGRFDLIATDMMGSTHYRRNVMLGEISKRMWSLEFSDPRQYSRNAVLLNTGTSRMMEVAYLTGMAATDWTWAPRIEDFDNDGWQDVLFTNGALRDVQHADLINYVNANFKESRARTVRFWVERAPQAEANFAFRNLGNLRFEDVSQDWGFNHVGVSYGVATADFDNDGDLDVVVNNALAPPQLHRNRSHEGNVVRVSLVGQQNNRFGLGARISVSAGGKAQVRYLTGDRGWQSASEAIAHFGLGEDEHVESVTVTWPGGTRQTFRDLEPNRHYRITESTNGASMAEVRTTGPLFAESDRLSTIQHGHGRLDELMIDPLFPKRFSWSRIALAVGDADADGDDDIYVGASEGHPGRVILMGADGPHRVQSLPEFEVEGGWLDTDAVFFDLEGDGDLDLVVVGSRVFPHPQADGTNGLRLYRNVDDGGFERIDAAWIPEIDASLNCVSGGDFDGDGDVDLFVGAGAAFGSYPNAASSRLFRNDDGRLVDVSPESFDSIGYATDAEWCDFNGDGTVDLVVTSEWGPVRWFENIEGTLRDSTGRDAIGRTGFWSSIAGGDLDGDGDIDFVVGNRGLNTFYRASEEEPAVLFYRPFGERVPPVTLEAYYEGGRLLPLRGFEQLVRRVSSLSETVINFHEFSSADLPELFPSGELEGMQRFAVTTLESGVFRNYGSGRFVFEPLPRLAQASPVNDLVLADFDGDSVLDILAAQNDFSINPVVGRFDGGVSMILLGNGHGQFRPLPPEISGVVVPSEARQVQLLDINQDSRADLVFAIPGKGLKAFLRQDNER